MGTKQSDTKREVERERRVSKKERTLAYQDALKRKQFVRGAK